MLLPSLLTTAPEWSKPVSLVMMLPEPSSPQLWDDPDIKV